MIISTSAHQLIGTFLRLLSAVEVCPLPPPTINPYLQ